MIQYRSGKWGLLFACRLEGSIFPKALALATPCALLSAGLHYILNLLELSNQLGPGDHGLSVLGGFSFVLGFLIVFNTQQAYARWWEGCTLLRQLRGEWFNAFSLCVAFCDSSPEMQEEAACFQHRLVRLVSMLYGAALSEVSEMSTNEFQFFDLEDFDTESMEFLAECRNKCEIVLQWVQRLIVDAQSANVLKVPPPILTRVYNQLGNGIVMLNNAAKLNDFPMPFPLAQIITFMMMLHWILTALVVASTAPSGMWAAFTSFGVIFAYWGVHYIGLELEQPFGDDPNDLPMQDLQVDLNISLRELMDKRARFPPSFAFQSAKHSTLETVNISLGGYIEIMSHCGSANGEIGKRRRVERPQRKSVIKMPRSDIDRGAEGPRASAEVQQEQLEVMQTKPSSEPPGQGLPSPAPSEASSCTLPEVRESSPCILLASPRQSADMRGGGPAEVQNASASQGAAICLDQQKLFASAGIPDLMRTSI